MGEVHKVSVTSGGAVSPEEAEEARVALEAANLSKADEGVTSIKSSTKDGEGNVDLKTETIEPVIAQRPESIPEKFWNAETGTVNTEAMIKEEEYLKEKAGESKTTTKESDSAGDKTTEGDDKSTEGQSNAVDAASKEFAETGELTDATYESLEKAGLSKDMVNAYIDGQKAVVGKLQDAAYGAFDGEEGFTKAQVWARENLSEAEVATLDVQITSDNPAIVAEGAKALKAKYEADADITPSNKIVGDNSKTTTGGYFKSTFEMQAAMSDKQYKVDPAFRAEVAQKIARAGEAGVNLF